MDRSGFAAATLICAGSLAATIERRALASALAAFIAAAALALVAPSLWPSPSDLVTAIAAGALALAAGLGWRGSRARPAWAGEGWRASALVVIVSAGLAAYGAYLVAASHDLMISDYMAARYLAVFVATLLRAHAFGALALTAVQSMWSEYSLFAPLPPGIVLAATSPLARAPFQLALAACFAAPAFLALGALARDIARRSNPSAALGGAGGLAVATLAIFVAFPGLMALVAKGLPDIGGVALIVVGLRLADRIARLLELPATREGWAAPRLRGLALALAALMFALFLFRRWYLFADIGLAAALAVEIAGSAIARGGDLRWRAGLAAAAAGGAILLALFAPIALDWARDSRAHDYAAIYSVYDYGWGALADLLAHWYGFGPIGLALGCAAGLAVARPDNRPLRLAFVASATAAAMLLRVQSMSPQHLLLFAPALAPAAGAAALRLFAARPRVAYGAIALCGVLTLTPIASAVAPPALLPRAALAAPPRADLAELTRLRAWIEANASPQRRYCVLGASLTVSSVIVANLWQLDPPREPAFALAERDYYATPRIDATDGPPSAELETCAWMLVADPVQLQIREDEQLATALPARELLSGEGLGARYRATGATFALKGRVTLRVYERIAEVTDDDVAALIERWRAAPRSDVARRAVARFF